MPRGKKRTRAAAAEVERFTTALVAVNDRASSSAPAADSTYQLVIINSCLTNEDIRLPCAPTPALLSSFYAHCSTTEEEEDASPIAGLTPWKAEYWLTRVAHVPLGRHSALPDAFRLRHGCASRLHARVVYVRTPVVHKRFAKWFPCIQREEEAQQKRVSEKTEEDDDVVLVESDDIKSAARSPSSVSSVFISPYYLIVNYSENPVYVGRNRVPRGRSVQLEEGDVLSFLECAFDDEGGVLDAVHLDPSQSPRATAISSAEIDTLVEPTWQLAFASLQQYEPGLQLATPTFPLRVRRRLVAHRRLYDVPSVIQDYVKWWWSVQGHPTAESKLSSSTVPLCLLPVSPSTSSSWVVSGNHLIRAPGTARSTAASTTPDRPPLLREGDGGALCSPLPLPTKHSDRNSGSPERSLFSVSALQDPAVAASLRKWLNDTEDMAEISDDALSPISARLTLDRAWLRRAMRRVCGPQRPEHSNSMRASPHASAVAIGAMKADSSFPFSCAKSADGTCGVDEETTAKPVAASVPPPPPIVKDDVAESFRVSSSPLRGGSAPQPAFVTPPREPSVVQAVLDELRRSRSEAAVKGPSARVAGDDSIKKNATEASCSNTDVPVRRSLHLDEELIELFTDNSPLQLPSEACARSTNSPQRDGSVGNSLPLVSAAHADVSTGAAGRATAVPGVRLEAAVLPVYVFTRRSRSPDVYTREGALLRPFSPISSDKAMVAAASAAQHVYYFDPEELRGGRGTEKAQGERDRSASAPASPTATTEQLLQETEVGPQLGRKSSKIADGGAIEFEWIDESARKETAGKRKRRRPRKHPL
ncbi:hypothetical protein ABB37_00243 [Leptomonas pyrrhocoris]|uniref:FHA domain-containing protein n=1 Tax=Leptomonas pyrrhocoris TaxID=157538 RepID=A0A0N0VHU9_LEPPY|nr:hypothetical protein ABB37_00243 [Leptomonas pyrrhocoris]KPA85944.1 hypothetical protein ABB37_00243 [Leptomonas pyrrhocoris]|eukprot:XP_015664383.1 hypothetical protein ABB37_00243 [Leptomonas pyrrhocoris]